MAKLGVIARSCVYVFSISSFQNFEVMDASRLTPLEIGLVGVARQIIGMAR